MSAPARPGVAIAILHRSGVDPALIGDILEEYGRRGSRLWLWRQVTASIALVVLGRVREPRPHTRRKVNLTAMPAGSPVGGLGLVAVIILVSIVSPRSWWLVAAAAMGGLALGGVMIVVRRRRAGSFSGRLLLVMILAGMAGVSVAAREWGKPVQAVRTDPVDGVLEAFHSHQVVMLPGGHGSKPFHDLVLTILRDHRSPRLITDVVVEFGSSRYQDLIDRFMRGEPIPDAELRKVWQNTTLPGATNDGVYVEEFYRAMRALNASLPPSRRIRVLAGDPPIDWNHVTDARDLRKWTLLRSTYPADLIRREVVARGRKALVVYGHLHFPRKEIQTDYDMSDWQAQTMTSWLEAVPGTKIFVIWPEGGEEIVRLQPEVASWPPLSLTRIRGTVLGAADFTRFNGNRDRYAIRGIDDFVKIPKEQHRSMRTEELVDAIIWNGNAPPGQLLLSASTCADPAYLPMRVGRIRLAGIPADEVDAVKNACAVHQQQGVPATEVGNPEPLRDPTGRRSTRPGRSDDQEENPPGAGRLASVASLTARKAPRTARRSPGQAALPDESVAVPGAPTIARASVTVAAACARTDRQRTLAPVLASLALAARPGFAPPTA